MVARPGIEPHTSHTQGVNANQVRLHNSDLSMRYEDWFAPSDLLNNQRIEDALTDRLCNIM